MSTVTMSTATMSTEHGHNEHGHIHRSRARFTIMVTVTVGCYTRIICSCIYNVMFIPCATLVTYKMSAPACSSSTKSSDDDIVHSPDFVYLCQKMLLIYTYIHTFVADKMSAPACSISTMSSIRASWTACRIGVISSCGSCTYYQTCFRYGHAKYYVVWLSDTYCQMWFRCRHAKCYVV
jgi:hypothetical protein